MRHTAASTAAIIGDVNLRKSRSTMTVSNITVLFARMVVIVQWPGGCPTTGTMALAAGGWGAMRISNESGRWMVQRDLAE